ncbi:hypothetical protein [Methylobacterium soli]|uniref:Uncharacterized protein n=1 Tax=Methylobacterium soli TaxID=553447 RepID=A0A6L3SRS4_9HYPH|nr:hypothetical protein [Methylobacterium soli]KAB1075429.1 hypothetical protein F6X53_25020 [Methylobacterium soli]
MTKPASFRDLIDTTFGGRDRFSSETRIDIKHADVMKHRDSIAPEHWPAIVRASERLGSGITLDDLADLRVKRKEVMLRRRSPVGSGDVERELPAPTPCPEPEGFSRSRGVA